MNLEEDYIFQFRDEQRSVPPHLAHLFEQFDTTLVTYDQGIEYINRSLLADRLQKAQDDVIRQHFRTTP